ncbi:multiple sugar transport system substrate-binding protein [Diaminobutyricimonas aerilata]|uniref:Multiple sugar transport system substrate-binding protein n=1 Tax=Diaminobutyricimonas aerilata TaxID=1162967 RepID=A0A2M9CFP7_9MICO|nr:ABC transporter substrate-binding protein [Diaminobutyricimonas aerilata]PJJ70672.1 multiple sugar transport system substrate-binding protein [Diaminobutyricimonas aerilata]
MFRSRRARIRSTVTAIAATGVLALTACAGGSGDEGSDGPVTLDFAFWGNDVRAEMYDEAIAAFNEEFPDIKVNVSFLGFPEFWEKRQIESTSGGLPDVMQFDYSYLRQYSENGLLLDLGPHLGEGIDTDPIDEKILDIGVVNDTTYGIATSTNAWTLYQNPKLLESIGAAPYEGGGSWEDYTDWVQATTDAAAAAGQPIYGGTDFTGRIQNFELQLRAQGSYLFNDDGEPGFDEDDLRAFWEQGAPFREGAGVPQQRLEEVYPLSGFDSAITASELTWDNFGAGYLGNLGEGYTELLLVEPPITEEGAKDLYLKPSMLHTISANTEHPEEAVELLNFLVNAPEVGAAFGTNRGLPASETQLEGVELGGLEAQIQEYEESISDRLGDPPAVPIVGYGSLEEKFRVIGTDLGLGVVTVDEAVEQFFTEMDVVLNQ